MLVGPGRVRSFELLGRELPWLADLEEAPGEAGWLAVWHVWGWCSEVVGTLLAADRVRQPNGSREGMEGTIC